MLVQEIRPAIKYFLNNVLKTNPFLYICVLEIYSNIKNFLLFGIIKLVTVLIFNAIEQKQTGKVFHKIETNWCYEQI